MMKAFALGFLMVVTPLAARAEVGEASPRFLVHLLDYLAKDYGGAVANGKILSKSEFHEQTEFAESAVKTNAALAETKGVPAIKEKLERLSGLIHGKADAAEVSALAREIQAEVIAVAKLEIAPTQWPSLARGRELFAKTCVSCHGVTGRGDGPAGVAFTPRPANFLDAHMRGISPFQAFNTIRLGVPGTGMAPFHGLSDKEVWDLAFFVTSLRYSGAKAEAADAKWDEATLRQVATSSDEKLDGAYGDRDAEKRVVLIASLRTHSNDDEGGGGSLAIAVAGLDSAVSDYESGNAENAKTKALKAYLEGIEPIEPRLKATDPSAVSDLEERMAAVRGAIESRKSLAILKSQVTLAKAEIEKAKSLLGSREMSAWVSFMAAAAIILREGFEAVLVIIALLGVIRAAGSKRAALWVHGGWVAALGLGTVAWFFSGWLMGISGAQRETLEGVTAIFAVVVLLFVGFWLHSQTEIGRWKAFIHGKVQKALDGKNLFGLATISFVAVFREAFETVLFLRAIWFEGGDGTKAAMASGVLSSIALVILMAWAILKFSAKLPIRKLFEASAVMMAALAVILTGKGVHSLQETGMISVTTPPMSFHSDWIGLYPTWETLAAQVVIFAAVMALWSFGKRPSHTGVGSPSPAA